MDHRHSDSSRWRNLTGMNKCLVSFRRLVSTAHLYNQPKWTTGKNQAQFGKCYSEYGHGHNYEIDFSWQIAEMTPALFQEFKTAAEQTMNAICDLYDHKHLSYTHPVFQIGQKISTTENLALQIWSELQNAWPKANSQASPSGVLVWEMPDLASSFGINPTQASAQLGLEKKSYVKQNKIAQGVRLGTKGRPLSLKMQFGEKKEATHGEPLQSDPQIRSLVEESAKLAETLPSLAMKLAKQLGTSVLLCDLEHHCAFSAP